MSYFEKQAAEEDPAEWSLRELAALDFHSQETKEAKLTPATHSLPMNKPADSPPLAKLPSTLDKATDLKNLQRTADDFEGDLSNTIKAFMEYLETDLNDPIPKIEVKYQTTESFRKNKDPQLLKPSEAVALPAKGVVELNMPYRPSSPADQPSSKLLERDDFGRLEELISAYKQSRPQLN